MRRATICLFHTNPQAFSECPEMLYPGLRGFLASFGSLAHFRVHGLHHLVVQVLGQPEVHIEGHLTREGRSAFELLEKGQLGGPGAESLSHRFELSTERELERRYVERGIQSLLLFEKRLDARQIERLG